MKRDFAIRAWNMAIAFSAPPKGCIHHTDRGSQYCSYDYQKTLRQLGFQVSMSRKGNCYDNAAPLGILRRKNLSGSGRDGLQNHQGRADLATVMGNSQAAGDGDIRIHKRVL